MDGHVHAFAFFGGVPLSVLYDNDRCLVSKILPPLGSMLRMRLPGKGRDTSARHAVQWGAVARPVSRSLRAAGQRQ